MKSWEKNVVVTGGAGFIGSCMVRTLNEMGIEDIIIVDNILSTEKWMNLRNKKYKEYVPKKQFIDKLLHNEYGEICGVIHMGACSSTTERDFDYLWTNNVQYTKMLWKYCSVYNIPMIYASSAATYGNGQNGFDDMCNINELRPLNGYGYSKQVFDQWSMKQSEKPLQHVGLKFFNVYGPNEYCKECMASMVYHGYKQIKGEGQIKLFKSENGKYEDGGQLRDFVYVKDVCNVIAFFMEHTECNGLFNVGTGKARSFKNLANAIFDALEISSKIEYIDMPVHLKGRYQYFTEADIKQLRNIGYSRLFTTLEEGIKDYVQNYLEQDFRIF